MTNVPELPALKTVGFKDMHPEQWQAFVELIHTTLSLADGYENEEVFSQTKELVDDVVQLFGGVGVEVRYDVEA